MRVIIVVVLLISVTACNRIGSALGSCEPSEDSDWLPMAGRGCLTKATVCSKLDPSAVTVRLRPHAGDLRDLADIVHIGNELSDLRLRFGCDDPTWKSAIDALAPGAPESVNSLPDQYVASLDRTKQLPLVAAKYRQGPLSENIDRGCPAAAALAGKARRAGDEFARKELGDQLEAARRECVRTADVTAAGPGNLIFLSFKPDGVLDYNFEGKAFPVRLTDITIKNTSAGIVLLIGQDDTSVVVVGLPPFSLSWGIGSNCDGGNCLLVPVREEDAKSMKPRIRTGEVQLAATVIGFGTVPSALNYTTRGNALIVRAVGLRLLSGPLPISGWSTIAQEKRDFGQSQRVWSDPPALDSNTMAYTLKVRDLGSSLATLSQAVSAYRNEDSTDDEALARLAIQACTAARAVVAVVPQAQGRAREPLQQIGGLAGEVCGASKAVQEADQEQLAKVERRVRALNVKVQQAERRLAEAR